jgi:solute carrier family 44 (choline transporter-like protein), member 2/4/5
MVSYSVTLWYFTPKDGNGYKDAPSCPLIRGFFVGICFHLGTLAFGAFLIATIRLIRMVLGYLSKQAEAQGNAVVAQIAKVMMCCISCFQRFMEFINKNAYMDVCIRSSSFLTAAKHAFEMITSELSTVAILNGACFIFQLAGGGVISGAGGVLTYVMVTTQDQFTSNDSSWYVADPVFVAVIAGILCLIIASAFMIIFDQAADTLLYCFIYDKNNPQTRDWTGERIEFAPASLQRLIGSQGGTKG